MGKKDRGAVHKLMAWIIVMWGCICFCLMLTLLKAGYVNRYLVDCLTQANLAALLVDPYHYGSTGELVFADIIENGQIWEETLELALGTEANQKSLGLLEKVEVVELRFYEVTNAGITESVRLQEGSFATRIHDREAAVQAPDGTKITDSALYARIRVPVELGFGMVVVADKEHCVDVAGGVENEK